MKGLYLIERLKQLIIDSSPMNDKRTEIEPMSLAISTIMSLSGDNKVFSLESIRRELMLMTGNTISRSAFWERLTTNRLFRMLVEIFSKLVGLLSNQSQCDNTLLRALDVEGISLFDASVVTLPEAAATDFGATFSEAGLKLHLEMDAQSANFKWAALTAANVHDSVCLPELSTLSGRLSIFDLGYYDWCFFKDLDEAQGLFLSRAKSNFQLTIDEVIQGIGKQHTGKNIRSIKFKRKRSKIIEFWSEKEVDGEDFRFRVIGYWNSREKKYHWYVTNLKCKATLIYPLYRFRWQIELLFKSAKSSLKLDRIPSANRMIILNLFLSKMIALLTAMLIREIGKRNLESNQILNVSLQRAAMVLVQIKTSLVDYLMSKRASTSKSEVRQKLKLLLRELIDPNGRNRKTTRSELEELCLAI